MGCFVNGTTQVQFEFDTEEIYFVDFQKAEIIYTVPIFIDPNPSQIWASLKLLDTLTNKELCLAFTALKATNEKNPPEERGKLTST